MDKTILIGLNGHAEQYRLDPNAYDRLQRYLDGAASRLRGDPDQAEILGDLERSVGDKLAALPGSGDRLVTSADIDGVLEEIGGVDTGREPSAAEAAAPARSRRLQRIHEGQMLAGVCTGLAAYTEVRVDWVRTFFVLATFVTAGLFGFVYVALVLLMPVADPH
jgi:phage shock protein PspC (stress-responsive transcriptional regulator)